MPVSHTPLFMAVYVSRLRIHARLTHPVFMPVLSYTPRIHARVRLTHPYSCPSRIPTPQCIHAPPCPNNNQDFLYGAVPYITQAQRASRYTLSNIH